MNLTVEKRVLFKTPAKINFFLNIIKKRDDGYHELYMDLIPVNLMDHITFSPSKNEGVRIRSNLRDQDPEKNLIIRAIRLLEQHCNITFNLDIALVKTIPVGAGLGGGSANAAGTLVVLNKYFELGLHDSTLQSLAVQLGADVPFFIRPQPSIAQGIGEILEPISQFPELYMLLLYPDVSIATSKAYKHCTISGRQQGIESYSVDSLKHFIPMNDFWDWASEKYPVLKETRDKLDRSGAVMSTMSGSGSGVFAVYKDKESRDKAWTDLSCGLHCEAYPFETLQSYDYDLRVIDPLTPVNLSC